MLKQFRKIYLPRILSLSMLANLMVQWPGATNLVSSQNSEASVFKAMTGIGSMLKFSWIGAQESASGTVFRLVTKSDSAIKADYFFKLNFNEAMRFRPRNLFATSTGESKVKKLILDPTSNLALEASMKESEIVKLISNPKSMKEIGDFFADYKKEVGVNFDSSAAMANTKSFNRWNRIKNIVERQTKRFPVETMLFFIAQGAYMVQEMIRNYEKNPMGIQNLVEGNMHGVSHLAFYSFMLASGLSAEPIALALRNPLYRPLVSFLPMAIGSLASSIVHDIFGEHPDLNKCTPIFAKKMGLVKPGSAADVQDIISCDQAYENFVKSFHSTKKTHEYASTIFALLTVSMIPAGTILLAKGGFFVLGEIALGIGLSLGANVMPMALGFRIGYQALNALSQSKWMHFANLTAFVWTDQIMNQLMKNVYYLPLDRMMITKANDKMKSQLKNLQLVVPTNECDTNSFRRKDNDCIHGPALEAIYEYRRQSDDFIDHKLMAVAVSQQQWASLVNNYANKYNASKYVYETMAIALGEKFKPVYKNTISLLDALDPFNGIGYKNKEADDTVGNPTFDVNGVKTEDNILASKYDTDNAKMNYIYSVVTKVEELMRNPPKGYKLDFSELSSKELNYFKSVLNRLKSNKHVQLRNQLDLTRSYLKTAEEKKAFAKTEGKFLDEINTARENDIQVISETLNLLNSILIGTIKIENPQLKDRLLGLRRLLGDPNPINKPGQALVYAIKNSKAREFQGVNEVGNFSVNFGNVKTTDFADSIIGSMIWGPDANSNTSKSQIVERTLMRGLVFNPPKIISGHLTDTVEKGSLALPYLFYTPVRDLHGQIWKNGFEYIRAGNVTEEFKNGYTGFQGWWDSKVESQTGPFWQEMENMYMNIVKELLSMLNDSDSDSIMSHLKMDKDIYLQSIKKIADEYQIPIDGKDTTNTYSARTIEELNLNSIEKSIDLGFAAIKYIRTQKDGNVISDYTTTKFNEIISVSEQKIMQFQKSFLTILQDKIKEKFVFQESFKNNKLELEKRIIDAQNSFKEQSRIAIQAQKNKDKNKTFSIEKTTAMEFNFQDVGRLQEPNFLDNVFYSRQYKFADYAIKSLSKVNETFGDLGIIIVTGSLKLVDGKVQTQKCLSAQQHISKGIIKSDDSYLARACGQK